MLIILIEAMYILISFDRNEINQPEAETLKHGVRGLYPSSR